MDPEWNIAEDNVAELLTEVQESDIKSLWVFGYGSLCWRPGFQFNKAVTGYVKGYARRMWQGNTTHRGTEDKPGRVATLIEDPQDMVHGVAFAISEDDAIPYLSKRECELGSYATQFTTFYPSKGLPFKVLAYVAQPENPLWLGGADEKSIAQHILDCSGPSGHNVEYLLRLADFMREHFPVHYDEHLFTIEKEILELIRNRELSLKQLMGNGEGCIRLKQTSPSGPSNLADEQQRTDTFLYSVRIQKKKLRCLNP
nr:unnamed protein product [Callosobruchus chinensis]